MGGAPPHEGSNACARVGDPHALSFSLEGAENERAPVSKDARKAALWLVRTQHLTLTRGELARSVIPSVDGISGASATSRTGSDHRHDGTRLTNAFSKKLANHMHALSIYFMHYNLVRIHQTLRVTPSDGSSHN